jgi:hypothetical protein
LNNAARFSLRPTSDAVLHTADDPADDDAVKHHAPAALDELKAPRVAP